MIEPAPAFLSVLHQLEDHGERGLFERQPFERIVLCRTGNDADVALIRGLGEHVEFAEDEDTIDFRVLF